MTSQQKLFIKRYLASSDSVVIYGAGYYGSLLSEMIGELGDTDVVVFDDFMKGQCGPYAIQNKYDFSDKPGTVIITIKNLGQATSIAQRLYKLGCSDIRLLSSRLKELLDSPSLEQKNADVDKVHRDDLLGRIKSFNIRKLNREYIAYSFRYLLSWAKRYTRSSRADKAVCPVCKGASRLLCVNVWNYLLMECEACTHIFVANVPSEDSIVDFYDGYDYFTQNCAHQGITSLTDNSQWQGWLEARLRFLNFFGLIESFCGKPAAILEVGCSEGKLLEYLKKQGHHVYGCDVNATLAALAGKTFGIDISSGTLAETGFAPGTFDLIIAIHTLEHLADPYGDLVLMRNLLKTGGKVVVEIPVGETDYNNHHHMHFFSERSCMKLFNDIFGNMTSVPSCFADANGNFCATALVVAEKA